jgi:transaldolase
MRGGQQVASLAGLDVLTMPPKVAAEYRENPAVDISPQVHRDPQVTLAKGIHLKDFNGATLWEVPETFKTAVDDLMPRDVDSLTPADLQDHFERAGFAGFLPRWSDEEVRTITEDGKIPVFERWKARLSAGEIGLDALINVSGLCSFATDQKSLDDRVKSLL